MKEKQLNARQLRERWLSLRAPIVLVPLLTILFWGLGGGKVKAGKSVQAVAKGLNMEVPAPKMPKNMPSDKLGMYEQAARDSAAQAQREKMEREYAEKIGLDVPDDTVAGAVPRDARPDVLIRKAKQKVAELEKVIATPSMTTPISRPPMGMPSGRIGPPAVSESPQMERLERVMSMLKQKESEPDPEMREINGVLDKLAALQSPRQDSGRSMAREPRKLAAIRVLSDDGDTSAAGEIEAMIPDGEVLTSGAEIRLELMSSLLVGGQTVEAGTMLYGVTGLSGERLRVTITSIHAGNHDWPVKLEAYDQDGMAGIYVPGAPTADALRESAGQDAGGFQPGMLSTSVAAQATGAGIQMARNTLTRKLRIVRVTVPGGYQLILKPQTE